MRTLLLTGTYPTKDRPSAGIFVRNQYQRLKRDADPSEEFRLFCVYTRVRGEQRSYLRILLAALRFLPHLIRHYDILHVHFLSPMLFAARLYKRLHPGTKILLTVHGSGLLAIQQASARVVRRYRRALRAVDMLAVAGPTLIQPLKKSLGVDADRVLCAGVDQQHFFCEAAELKEYDFIYVGAFNQGKGLDIVINALKKLDDLEIRACFVGSGPLDKDLLRAGHSLYIDVFHDVPQRRLRHLYNRSRFLVFASRGDGFGLVVSEAMYCGTPTIVFAESGAQVQVRHNENGLIYKPNTPEKLARTLGDAFRMNADTYRALALAARNANPEFALETVCRELLGIYRELHAGTARVPAKKT